MNEKYVVSLELAKKLKELGVPQRSEFWWNEYEGKVHLEITNEFGYGDCSAYLSDELLEWLPTKIKKLNCRSFMIREENGEWFVRYFNFLKLKKEIETQDKLLPNALAKMLIYLIEQGIIKTEEGK